MKIEISEGCTAFWTKIDGKEIGELSKEEFDEVLDKVFGAIKGAIERNESSFDSLVHVLQYEDYRSVGGTCDQCGDSQSITTWEV